MDERKIGTIRTTSGRRNDVVGCLRDGRWSAELRNGDDVVRELGIPTQTTFGKLKQLAAQRFAAPHFEFLRDQPNVEYPAPAPVSIPEMQAEDEPRCIPNREEVNGA